jgi:inhibitor of cysteine peptidase
MIILSISVLSFSGCVDTTNNSDNRSENNNSDTTEYIYKTANIENIKINILESFPVQVIVVAEGYFPDGCTQIHEIEKDKQGNNFNITITTKRPKDKLCTQQIVPFKENISLDVEDLKAGVYNVSVNGVNGTFELTIDNVTKK